MEGISKEELRIQYDSLENKPQMGFQILLSNIYFLLTKGIVTNQIIGSSGNSFMLKCNQKTPNGIIILTVRAIMVNSYSTLSNAVELYENQVDIKYVSEYIQVYDSFCYNKNDEVMNYVRRGFYRYTIDEMYKLNSSFKGQGVLNRFDLIQKWIDQLIEALSLLHERGLYHGGVKASNIFVDENSNQIRIIDYGFYSSHVNLMNQNYSKDVYTPLVFNELANSFDQKRFNDIYALIILIYQMAFGFDNSHYQIKQLQKGITFNDEDDGRDHESDDTYEFKLRIIKLVNKIVCKAALGTEEQRKKITLFYVSDVLQQKRNVESFQNSPKHIAETLQVFDNGQKVVISSERVLAAAQPQQQNYDGDSKTDYTQEELYLQEMIYQQQKQHEQEQKQIQQQIYSNENLTLQQKIDVYKKLDYEKYQHSSSQNSTSNILSPEKNQAVISPLFQVNQSHQLMSEIQEQQVKIENYEKEKQYINPVEQEQKLDQILQMHRQEKDLIINQQNSDQINSTALDKQNSNLVQGFLQDNKIIKSCFDFNSPINTQPTSISQHIRTYSSAVYDHAPNSAQIVENPEKIQVTQETKPDEIDTQQNKILEEKYEDFWVIDLSHKNSVQRGADYHPSKYQEQIKQAQLKQQQNEIEDIYTQVNQRSNQKMTIQQTLLKQIEQFDKQQQQQQQQQPEKTIQQTAFQQDSHKDISTSQNCEIKTPYMSTEQILSNSQENQIIRFPNGAIQYEGQIQSGQKNGYGVLYNCNGTKMYEGSFKDDFYHGFGMEYYENGQILHQGNFEKGLLNGFAKTFYKNGSLCYEGDYVEGICHGNGTKYDESSSNFQQGQYQNGKMIGVHKKYQQNGQIIFETNFKNNKRDGKSIEYHQQGGISFEGTYKNGKKMNGIEYDHDGNKIHEGDYEQYEF
ncbi:MORN repeat protein (macronuclear) [Tetrahymena thermophila SB210]|uniref:MORN repeat protein n=1 Tax=Tetrahymena thermophila (strain SB210) TaxID=312017 RepID=I7MEN7_TETTS|nr:MORN repeat protein [Tetrahymena thermophila SB210]EAR97268.1 MORN repeat protein [Tetrahymena thermophila SB210]|eukprot:XP_001017513.1 MORN repeat protein [Tetrahymena thermophila SB210]